MKANKSILALLLALTLLLGWTPVAWAEKPTISIRVLPWVDNDFDILCNGEELTVKPGTGDAFDLVQIEIDSEDEELILRLKYKKKYWSVEEGGGVTVGTAGDYGWKMEEFNYTYGSTEDGDWICDIKIEKDVNLPDDFQWKDLCEINIFDVQMVPPSATLTYDDGVEDESVSDMPASTPEQVKLPNSDEESTPMGTFTAAAAPTRSGYSFQGWRANWGNKELYGARQEVTVTALPEADLTLTAEWKKMSAIPGKPVEGGDSGSGDSTQSYYYIHADGSAGGSVSPSGYTRVSKNGSLTVSFAPKSGYSIQAVYVDGVKTGTADGQYTFSNVTADHKIYVQFEETDAEYDDVPKTGDEAPLAAAAGLGLLALLGLGCLLASRRRA